MWTTSWITKLIYGYIPCYRLASYSSRIETLEQSQGDPVYKSWRTTKNDNEFCSIPLNPMCNEESIIIISETFLTAIFLDLI